MNLFEKVACDFQMAARGASALAMRNMHAAKWYAPGTDRNLQLAIAVHWQKLAARYHRCMWNALQLAVTERGNELFAERMEELLAEFDLCVP